MNSKDKDILDSSYHKQTLIGALIAAFAATIIVYLSLPLWVMFIGLIGYSTSSGSTRDTIISGICMSLGFLLGVITVSIVEIMNEIIGGASISIAVFIIALLVVSLRKFTWLGNVVSWFLGLVTLFASHSASLNLSFLSILLTILFGLTVGYFSALIQQSYIEASY